MRKRKFPLKGQKKAFDFVLLVIVVILVLSGLVFVYDVSVIQAYRDFGDSYYYIRQQLLWALLGAFVGLLFAYFDYRNLKKISGVIFVMSLVLLVAVFIPGLGTEAGGAHRWLNFYFFTIQPAEIVKFASVLWLASTFEKKISLKPLVLLVIPIVAAVMGVLQRDLGSTVVFVVTTVMIYLISGGSLWQMFIAVPILVAGFLGLIITSEYRRNRVMAFLDPFSDPQGFTYHISQVLVALGSGGIFGLGLGQSRQKFYIPEVTTDSIFAVIGEEMGLLGGILVVAIFFLLVWRGLKIAERCSDNFGKILAVGITSWIGIQAIVNLGAMVSLFPLTGVPLPFISYGGSALVANLAAVGILLNISKHSSS